MVKVSMRIDASDGSVCEHLLPVADRQRQQLPLLDLVRVRVALWTWASNRNVPVPEDATASMMPLDSSSLA